MARHLCAHSFAFAAVTLSSTGALAFSISSALSTACHEPITMEALRSVRADEPAAGPLVSDDRNDRALIDDVPFLLDEDMRDLGAVSLLLGVRDNDLKGRDPNELDSLALVHGEPAGQREHCLRSSDDDEPTGTPIALLACRGFINQRFLEALDGLDAHGRPTLDERVDLAVGLSLRGKLKVPLPLFYVRLGQALHALQDGFTHTYRSEDRTQVTVALNYVDVVNHDHLSERDGPGHSMELDRCDAPDRPRARNRQLAVEASVAVLHAALQPGMGRDQKLAALEVILDRYLSYQPGCTAPNGWCSAPEAAIKASLGCGCGPGAGWGGLLGLGLVLLASRRRRGAALRGRSVAAALLLCLTVPFAARAQVEPAVEATPAIDSKEAAIEGTTAPLTAGEVQAVQKEQSHRRALFSIYAAGAGSLYNVAVSGIFGVRLRFHDYWQLGLDAELNGWYGIHDQKMRTGATNLYLSLIVRYPLKYEQINLRSTLQLGTAIQMFDLYGVPRGSVGFYGGLNPLGIEVKLSGHLYLIFYPLGFALPVTQLKGAPFAFVQFRTTLGLEVTF